MTTQIRIRPALSALLFVLAGVLAAADAFAGLTRAPEAVARNEGRVCVSREGGATRVTVDPMLGCFSTSCTERVKSEVEAVLRPGEIAVESDFVFRRLTDRRICTSDCMGARGRSVVIPALAPGDYRLTLGGREIGRISTAELADGPVCAAAKITRPRAKPRRPVHPLPRLEAGRPHPPPAKPRSRTGQKVSENEGRACFAPGPRPGQIAIRFTPGFGCASPCNKPVAQEFDARVRGGEIRLSSRFVLAPPEPGAICATVCVPGGQGRALVDVDDRSYSVTLGGAEIGRVDPARLGASPVCFSR